MVGTIEEELAACRARFAGVEVGSWVRFCHHMRPVEKLREPPENRINYIICQKPEHERAIRLHEFWPIPNDMAEEYAAQLKTLGAVYWAKRNTLDPEYYAKRKLIDAPIIALVPDTSWDGDTILG